MSRNLGLFNDIYKNISKCKKSRSLSKTKEQENSNLIKLLKLEMSSIKKLKSKNLLKHSVNETEKSQENENIPSVMKNFVNYSKEKHIPEKIKLKKYETNNVLKPLYDTENTKIYNTNILNLENKNIKGNNINQFNFNLAYNKNLKNKINNSQNLNNKSCLNSSTNNANFNNLNFSMKNPKEIFLNNNKNSNKDMLINLSNNQLYLFTEPEKSEFFFNNTNHNYSNQMTKNSINSNVNNFLKTNPNNTSQIMLNLNTNGINNSNIQNQHFLLNKLKKSSSIINPNKNSIPNSYNKIHINNSTNIQNSNISNQYLNFSNFFAKNNKKANPLTLSNNKSLMSQQEKIQMSPKDFIDEFFDELEKYYTSNADNLQTYNINKMNILQIFDNIFKNIITGEKQIELVDVEIKKKLSKYSEIWKKFLFSYEKMSIKLNGKNNSLINNIDLSTKNVINHHISESCMLDPIHGGKGCYQILKNELEEKFTNTMKNEIGKIRNLLEEKEKIIEDLTNQINIKNSYISEIQESLNNYKSKGFITSMSALNSENKSHLENQIYKENLLDKGKKIKQKYSDNTESNNNFEELNYTSNEKESSDLNPNDNELLLYDQKQFIREKKLLINENKDLFDKVNEMEKHLIFQKEKEIKLMKVLFFLNKQGIPIEEIIQNEILSDKSRRDENNRTNTQTPMESSKSMDSLMFLPITIEKPKSFTKPDVIPLLDLRNINSKFNLEYGSPKNLVNYQTYSTDPSFHNNSYFNNTKKDKNNQSALINNNDESADFSKIIKNQMKNKQNKFNFNSNIKSPDDDKKENFIKQNISNCEIDQLQSYNSNNNMKNTKNYNFFKKDNSFNKDKSSLNVSNNKDSIVNKTKNTTYSNNNQINSSNQILANNHKFKLFTNNIKLQKESNNLLVNDSFGENFTNTNSINFESRSNNVGDKNNILYTSINKKITQIADNENSFFKNSSSNIANNSMIKPHNDKIKITINNALKSRVKNLFRNKQGNSLTKSLDVSNSHYNNSHSVNKK